MGIMWWQINNLNLSKLEAHNYVYVYYFQALRLREYPLLDKLCGLMNDTVIIL